MPEIVAYEYRTSYKVSIDVELYQDGEGDPSVMVTARHGYQILPVPLTADQAELLAHDIAEVAAELHAREVTTIGGQ